MPAPKILAKKKDIVAKLADEVKEAQSVVFFSYQGLTVEEDTAMRNGFREEEVSYKVVKNSYVKRAFSALDVELSDEELAGPTALAYSTKDVVSAPRLCKKFSGTYKVTKIKGGVVEGKKVEIDTINQLADIPAKEVLYGRLLMGLLFPLTKTAMVFKAMAEKGEEQGFTSVKELAEAAKAAAPAKEENTEEAPAEAPAAE